jgi:hypothetical protein
MQLRGKMKKIKFIPTTEKASLIIDPPSPSKTKIPKWFKQMPLKIFEEIEETKAPFGNLNLTMKACPAIVDTITMGYTITLDADVLFVDPQKYGHRVIWDVSWQMITQHTERQIPQEFVPEGFEKIPLKWERASSWAIETPSGYSLLYMHPFYRNDLPFMTLPGVVDSDVYNTPINLPFFIKENFYGKIEKGTPIAQIIPIKRELWKNEVEKNILKNYEHKLDLLKSTIYQSYKKKWWRKKSYK